MRIGSGGRQVFANICRRPKLRVPGEDGSSPRAPVTSTEGSSGSSVVVERRKRWLAKSHHRGPRRASLETSRAGCRLRAGDCGEYIFRCVLYFSHRAVETGKSPASRAALAFMGGVLTMIRQEKPRAVTMTLAPITQWRVCNLPLTRLASHCARRWPPSPRIRGRREEHGEAVRRVRGFAVRTSKFSSSAPECP
jgi:hypothetical protein